MDVGSLGVEVGNGNVRGNTFNVGGGDSTVCSKNVSPGVRSSSVGPGGFMTSPGHGARASPGFDPNGSNANSSSTHLSLIHI